MTWSLATPRPSGAGTVSPGGVGSSGAAPKRLRSQARRERGRLVGRHPGRGEPSSSASSPTSAGASGVASSTRAAGLLRVGERDDEDARVRPRVSPEDPHHGGGARRPPAGSAAARRASLRPPRGARRRPGPGRRGTRAARRRPRGTRRPRSGSGRAARPSQGPIRDPGRIATKPGPGAGAGEQLAVADQDPRPLEVGALRDHAEARVRVDLPHLAPGQGHADGDLEGRRVRRRVEVEDRLAAHAAKVVERPEAHRALARDGRARGPGPSGDHAAGLGGRVTIRVRRGDAEEAPLVQPRSGAGSVRRRWARGPPSSAAAARRAPRRSRGRGRGWRARGGCGAWSTWCEQDTPAPGVSYGAVPAPAGADPSRASATSRSHARRRPGRGAAIGDSRVGMRAAETRAARRGLWIGPGQRAPRRPPERSRARRGRSWPSGRVVAGAR